MANRSRNRRVVVHLTDLSDPSQTGLHTPELFAKWFRKFIEGVRDFQVEYIRVEDTEPLVYEEGGERVGG